MRGKLLDLPGVSPLTGVTGEEAATLTFADPQPWPGHSRGVLTCSTVQEVVGGASLPAVSEEAAECSDSARLWHPGRYPADGRPFGSVWLRIRKGFAPITLLPGTVRGEIGRPPAGPGFFVPFKPQTPAEQGCSNVITAC